MKTLVLSAAIVLFLTISGVVAAEDFAAGGSMSAAPGVTCRIQPYHDRPVMFIDGQPRFPMAYMSYYPEPFRYRQIGEHGVHVYTLSLTLTDKWFNRERKQVSHNARGIWRGPDELDFSTVEKGIGEVLAADPQAYIFPRIYCDSPDWWDRLHADDIRAVSEGCPLRQSFSSMRWREETVAVLQKIVRHVSASAYGPRVIGYMICAGQTEEYGDQPDTTGCAQARFRQWLAARYGNDAAAIGRRFGKELDAIVIPSAEEQARGDCGNFLDPARSQLTIDYRLFHSEEAADTAITLCRAVKEASERRLITGVFYGYTRIWPDWGHLALRRLLASDAVDFISNPYSSGGTKSHLWIGDRDFHTFTEFDSVLKAGKLFYFENDIRTAQSRWISQLRPEIDPKGEYNLDAWLGPPTVPDSLQLLKAVFAKVLASGEPAWWFDLWGGWYDHPETLRLFGEMQRLGDESLQHSSQSAAQIAVVLDENAYRYLPAGVSQFGGRFAWIEAQLSQLGKVGAPYDFYLLDDLRDLDLARYRMIVFLNAFVLSAEQRQMIRQRCMCDGRTLLWLYAPGAIDDNLSADHISSLLGMECRMADALAGSKVSVELPEGARTYEAAAVAPFFYVAAGADAGYAHTAAGQLVLAEKAAGDSRNVFAALPPLSWPIVQSFAKRAGVHIYSETGEVVFANQRYLAVAAATAGRRTVRMPTPRTLRELLPLCAAPANELPASELPANEFGAARDAFELEFAPHTCRLFEWRP